MIQVPTFLDRERPTPDPGATGDGPTSRTAGQGVEARPPDLVGAHPVADLAGDAGDRDARELPRHPVPDLVVDLGQDALDVLPARALGVGLAAVQREDLVLRLDGPEDVQGSQR